MDRNRFRSFCCCIAFRALLFLSCRCNFVLSVVIPMVVVNCGNVLSFPENVCNFILQKRQYRLAHGKCVYDKKIKCGSSFHFKLRLFV